MLDGDGGQNREGKVMRQFKATLTVLALAISSSLLLPSTVDSQEYNKIEGVVLDAKNKPVGNVWVRIYRGVEEIDSSQVTELDGRYEIKLYGASPITTIRYDHLAKSETLHPAIVTNISSSTNHKIDKVMPGRVGYGLDQLELLEILSAYERLYVIDAAGDLSGIRREIRDRYRGYIGMMKHVDPITEQRLNQLADLYDKKQ